MVASRRLIGLVQFGAGWVLIVRPHRIARLTAGPDGATPDKVVRVLGARFLVQGLGTLVRPTDTVMTLAGLVDATHTASMLPVAVFSRRYRRPAALSALSAAAFAVVSLRSVFARPADPDVER